VVLQDARELGLVANVAHPAGELTVPAQSVAADGLVVLGGPVDQVVAASKVELALGRLGRVPLHAVLGRNLPKVGLDHRRRLPRGQTVLVGAGAVVQLALGLHQRVDAVGRLSLRELLSRRRREDAQRGEEVEYRGFHFQGWLFKSHTKNGVLSAQCLAEYTSLNGLYRRPEP
jgi:hypothetical protein